MSAHSPSRKSFGFNKVAKERDCYGERCRILLLKGAIKKQDGKGGILFTPNGLKAALTEESILKILNCGCRLCLHYNEHIDPQTNLTPVQAALRNEGALKLLAALCLMGCVFAFRPLDSSRLQNMDGVKDMLETSNPTRLQSEARDKIQKSLSSIAPTNSFHCIHSTKHSNTTECLYRSFRDRFLEKKNLLDTPTFVRYQPDARLEKVSDDVNLPFVREVHIVAHSSPSHNFYLFSLCTAFIQEDENDRDSETSTLFRKEIRLSEGAQEGRTSDQDVLNYMARQNHSSIAKLIFAYTHERDNAKFDNLIFEYYPLDLQKIISGPNTFNNNSAIRKIEEACYAEFTRAIDTSTSLTDHPAWLGMLGVLDAVKVLHNAPSPVNNESGFVIGGHFDIKPANILVDTQRDMRFVLTDFGQAKLKLSIDESSTSITGAPGTPAYQPPDRFDGGKKLDRMYDIWSLACVLTEVLVFIKTKDVVQFREARLREQTDDRYKVADFWRYESREIQKPCLKKAVQDRLAQLAEYDDTKRYVEIIKNMFSSVLNGIRNGVDFYLQELRSPNGIDESFFCDQEDPIGDGTTSCPISEMKIKISRRKGDIDGRILLHSGRDRRSTFSLSLIGTIKVQRTAPTRDGSTKSMKEKILVCADTYDVLSLVDSKIEEIVPYSMCEHQTLRGQYRIGFRYGHNGSHIIFASQKDMDMFLGAITRHYPRPGSTFHQVRCRVEVTGPKWKSTPKIYESGSVHILQRLDNARYKELFINQDDGCAMMQFAGRAKIAFRLLFYGHNAGLRRCLIIELGEVDVSTQKPESESKKSIIKAPQDHKLRIGTIKASEKIAEDPRRHSDPACYPGIPLKPDGLTNIISSGKTASRIVLEFEEPQHRRDFEEICQNLFHRDSVARSGSLTSESW